MSIYFLEHSNDGGNSMSLYFLEHDLFIASTYNSNGYLILDSCVGEYGGYFRNVYLFYSELEAIQIHVKRFHELDLTMDEIQHEIKQQMEA